MLGNCVTSHIECSIISNRPGYMPTRIIDVGRLGDSFQPRLVISAEQTISEPYAALSYSWGGSWPCALTTAKLEEYQSSIPVHMLPKTLYDATTVARKLGISYLWIDALTIIQDDRVDWERESKTMADVYRNAVLTIAGLSSTSSDHGLFRLRNPLVFQPCWLTDSSDGTSIFALPGSNGFDEGHVKEMPLLSRGWTFQERLLGSRILYFGDALVWECCNDMVVELLHCRHEDDWEFRKDWPALASKRLHEEIQALKSSTEVAAETLKIWHDLVMQYSRTQLTVASDRLIAITGLARLVESHTNLRFVAGIWTPFSLEQLIWSSQDSIPCVTNQAPTWSWLNTSKAVDFHTIDLRKEYYRAEILDVNIIPKSPNSSTEHLPLRGKLHIKGLLLRFKKFKPDNDDQHADDLEIESLPSVDIGWFYWDQEVHNNHQWLQMRGEQASKFYFLILSWGLHLKERRWSFQGLVLVHSTAALDAYERRGFFEVSTQIEGDTGPSLHTQNVVLV
jgi:Heterokaryon incompatibility protein (HET)